MKRETLTGKARILFFAVVILLGKVLMFAVAQQAGAYTQEVKTEVLVPSGVTLTPNRLRWDVAKEASGYWGVVGETVIKNVSATAINIKQVRLSVFNASDLLIAESVYKKPRQFAEMLIIVYEQANGELAVRAAGTTRLEPGDTAFLLLSSAAEKANAPAKANILARFTDGTLLTCEVALAAFDAGQQMQWPLKFGDGNWVALNTAYDFSDHRKAIFPFQDEAFISQRFALDTVQIDAQGKRSKPRNSPRKEDYYAFGEEIMSPGEGTVVAVVKDLADQEIGASDPDNPAGNYVIIQHAPNLYSAYAHMQQGSAVVAVGDQVSAGQLLGRVGNSGNSSEPHLHIHFMDNWDNLSPVLSVFTSQGVPALFWNAKVIRGQQTYLLNGATPIDFDVITNP